MSSAARAELCVVRHERLLVNVLLVLEHSDRAGGFGDARSRGWRRRPPIAPAAVTIASDAFAQFLDLAPGRQDSARLDLGATSHQVRPAEARRPRCVAIGANVSSRERHRLLEALGDIGLGNDFAESWRREDR